MSKKRVVSLVLAGALAAAAALYIFAGDLPGVRAAKEKLSETLAEKEAVTAAVPPPAVAAVRVAPREFVETVLVTGSLVARDDIIVVPEVEGLRIVELKAEEGDRVNAGDVLAVLESEALSYQVQQRDAALVRAEAAIAQAKNQIAEAKARQDEAAASLKRAKPLQKNSYISESVVDQRRAAALSASAQVAAAEDGLRVAEASKAEIEAQRRELEWRVTRTKIKAPVSGLIAKRNARVGDIAIGANAFSSDTAMFRIVARGEVELDAEVPEMKIAKVKAGQMADVDVAGVGTVQGRIRLVSPEIDRTTRLGRVRIFLGDDPRLRVGSFARAEIKTAAETGLSVPLSAVLYTDEGARVLVIENDKARARPIERGLIVNGMQEVTAGLAEGDLVVAKSATFLRDGDAVRAVVESSKPDDPSS